MQHLLDRRILFFGGKGGVGKTTCAAAVALGASRQGKRVLLVSTDPAHSTADVFERPFSHDETGILDGLTGIELDARVEARRYVDEVKQQVARLFSPSIQRQACQQIDLAATMPGVEEVALFDRMGELIANRDDRYDLIVFDTAPTGHTLRLLRMPELLTSWIQALTASRQAIRTPDAGPDPVLEALERRQRRLEEVRSRLTGGRRCAIVLVLIPERLPIAETTRAVEALAECRLPVGGLIVNRVLPAGLDGDFYLGRQRQEQMHLDDIDRRFQALPRARVPQLEQDVHGLAALERVGASLLGPR